MGSNEYFDRAETDIKNICRSAQPMSLLGPGCVKTRLSQGRAELFSQLPSPKRSRGAIGSHNDETETEILRATSKSEFSHSLGHFQTSSDAITMSAFLPLATELRTLLEVRFVPQADMLV
jgi:hypothetical protein